MPSMPPGVFALFVAGGLWLALWTGPVRLWGWFRRPSPRWSSPRCARPTSWYRAMAVTSAAPEKGGTAGATPDARGLYPRKPAGNGQDGGNVRPLDTWPAAVCNADFCRIALNGAGVRSRC
jgi:competence protein ComEC